MGAWGYGTLDHELALDWKYEYDTLLSMHRSHEEAAEELIESFGADYEEEFEEYILFWPALAELQIKHGFILKKVKEKTLSIIDNDYMLKELWEEGAEERKKVLLELKGRILELK